MKGNKTKFSASHSHVTNYELQRLQKLKSNAERMSAQGPGSLANKILQQKTKDLLSPSARQTEDDSTSEYDGEDEGETMEDDNLASGKRKALFRSQKKLHSIRTRETDVLEMNSQKRQFCDTNSIELAKQVKDHGIQTKQQQQRIGSKNKGKKIAFCSPGSMSAYLEFRKRQKENNEVLQQSNQSLYNSMTGRITTYHNDALNAIYENADDDGLNENSDAVDVDGEGDQEFDQQVVAQYGMEASTNELSSKRKNHRGPTMLRKVHARTIEERPLIVLNSLGQPVGPTKEIVQEFKFFLGTVARDSELAPLNYVSFPSLPTLDKIWDYVQEKYMVPDAGINWVMDAVNNCWKYHKCQIKKKHFYAYDDDDLRWKNKPNTISDFQFRDLLLYWHTDEAKKISHNNKDNRLMLDDMHTMGRKSFAILRHDLQQQDPDKKEPSEAKVYKESRKRLPGRTYKSSCEKAMENIAKMDAVESAQHEDGNNCKDPYYDVIPTAKRKSRLRLYGSSVKKADLKKKDKKPNFILPEEFIATVTTAVLAQIRDANPGMNIVIPDVLQSTPNDACSAPNQICNQSGQSSKSFPASNQEHYELDGDE